MTIYQYSFPTTIHFGSGAVRLLPDSLLKAGKRRPLLVTDRALSLLAPATDAAAHLKASGLEVRVFSGVWGNPVLSQVSAGVGAFRQHAADSIVGLGGGAALDVAKAIALMVHHPGELFDYEDEKPGARPIDGEIPWWGSVPTTAGTGSEVGRSTVISDERTRVKKVIFSPRLLAQRVFVDPDLTMGLPPAMTAATGMDALTHLVEAYLARGFQPLCDGIALEGVRLVARSLPRCVEYAHRIEHGEKELLTAVPHREARGLMLNAALMGGVAFQKGLGVTHSLAHALSTVCDLHHGLANGICIPYAMAFNREAAGARLAELGALAGASAPGADGFVTWLEELKVALGIPRTLADVGVTLEHVDSLVACAFQDGCHANNPKPVTERDFRQLFRSMLV